MGLEIQAEELRNDFRGARCYKSRVDALVRASSGKKVVHIGCVDAGFYRRHSEDGRLLHAELCRVAKQVIGVDVDGGGIDIMRQDGFQNLVMADITELAGRAAVLQAVVENNGTELIVCGETIEHVPDPLRFMSGVLAISRGTGAEVILTTPNPFYLSNFVNATRGIEVVHPDHNAYLSAANLKTLIRKAGGASECRVDYYTNLSERRWRARIKTLITAKYPMLADGVLMTIRG